MLQEGDWRTTAELFGVRTAPGGEGLLVDANHAGLRRALSRSKWAGYNLERLLGQVVGVVRSEHPQRFGAGRARCLVFGRDVLGRLGVSLTARAEDGDGDDG